MDTGIIGDEGRQPRQDAVLIKFYWYGRAPRNVEAIKNAPQCVLDAKTNWGTPGIYVDERGDLRMVCDGNYGRAILVKPLELPELVSWLDTYFSDLGSDYYGGHWRTARGAYSLHCFYAEDWTHDEINRYVEQQRCWPTFEPFLNRTDY